MTDKDLTKGFLKTPEEMTAGFLHDADNPPRQQEYTLTTASYTGAPLIIEMDKKAFTAYADDLATTASSSSESYKLYRELRRRSKDSTIGKDERNIAHREAERLYELHLDEQAKAYNKECEDMFRSDVKHLVNVVSEHYMPMPVRKFASKELFMMESFMLKVLPEDWTSEMERLTNALGTDRQRLIYNGRTEAMKELPFWKKQPQ